MLSGEERCGERRYGVMGVGRKERRGGESNAMRSATRSGYAIKRWRRRCDRVLEVN